WQPPPPSPSPLGTAEAIPAGQPGARLPRILRGGGPPAKRAQGGGLGGDEAPWQMHAFGEAPWHVAACGGRGGPEAQAASSRLAYNLITALPHRSSPERREKDVRGGGGGGGGGGGRGGAAVTAPAPAHFPPSAPPSGEKSLAAAGLHRPCAPIVGKSRRFFGEVGRSPPGPPRGGGCARPAARADRR
ncbi:unnamed protein product, partial [Prorocentrum cordatum]